MADCRIQTREQNKVASRGLHVVRHRKLTEDLECRFNFDPVAQTSVSLALGLESIIPELDQILLV